MCETCTLPNCIICLTQTICGLCDSPNLYYVVEENQTVPYIPTEVGKCAYCDPSNGEILNSTGHCELSSCTLNQCIQCLNMTDCQLCN